MSETCIVCLGDLGEGANDVSHAIANLAPSNDSSHEGSPPTSGDTLTKNPTVIDESDMIAHLLPCGHNLHNDCLKPWVERANSCPICRQNFNSVELSQNIGGEFRTAHRPISQTNVYK